MSIPILMTTGGTGGHVFPALALAEKLRELEADCEILFVGSSGGIEERLVPEAGFNLEALKVKKWRGKGVAARLAAMGQLPLATRAASRLIKSFRPRVVVGLGGFASAPVVLASALMRKPVVLLEQNAIPGTTNRWLARFSDTIVTAFRTAEQFLPATRTVLLGNPVRQAILDVGQHRTSDKRCLAVLGGSQGAHAINELMIQAAPLLMQAIPELQLIHQTGSSDHLRVEGEYRKLGLHARVQPFINKMEEVFSKANFVVGRSGATTIAELSVVGIPALLIPYPYAADDHQAANAAEVVEAGGALMKRQSELSFEGLAQLITGLLLDVNRLEQMALAMKRFGRPEATIQIAKLCLERAGK